MNNLLKAIVSTLLLVSTCLLNPVFADLQSRIIGGTESTVDEWPFMTGIMFKNFGVTAGDQSLLGSFMSGSNREVFSGKLVDCEQGFNVCQDVEGNICLIERGETFFFEKVANCAEGGGIAAIIYNHEEGFFFGTLGDQGSDIPAVSINRENGLELLNFLNQDISFGYVGIPPIASFCGGTYIGDKWILTAAHCVENADPEELVVNIGGHDLKQDQNTIINVERIIVHPDFNSLTVSHDIALLEISRVPEGITPIALADEPTLAAAIDAKANALTLGRGQQTAIDPDMLNAATPTTSKLFQVELPLLSNDACNESLNNYYSINKLAKTSDDLVTDVMVCAGEAEGEIGACLGDSGGPLLIENNDEMILVGITSWGIGCAQPGLYDVYTRVPYFKNEIERLISGEITTFSSDPAKIQEPVNPPPGTTITQNSDDDKSWYGALSLETGLLLVLLMLSRIKSFMYPSAVRRFQRS